MRISPNTEYAAGAVLWHDDGTKVRVLVIHRGHRDDYSLAKGKLDPGEELPETAVREIREETGYEIRLGVPLGVVEYVLPNGKQKEVHYWAAEVDVAEFERVQFEANDEVDSIEWLGKKKSVARLNYEGDRRIVGLFFDLVEAGVHRSFSIIAVRHAKATSAYTWRDDDATRPLTDQGRGQAQRLPRILAAYGAKRIYSSPAVRCIETITPTAEAERLGIHTDARFAQSDDGSSQPLAATITELVRAGTTTIVCTHAPVIHELVTQTAALTESRVAGIARAAVLDPGELSVLHLALDQPDAGVLAVESMNPHV